MVEVEAPLPLDGQVHVDQVVAPWCQTDEPGNEKYKPLDARQVWVAVSYYASDDQTWVGKC